MAVGLRLFTARAGNGVGEPIVDTDNGEELVHVQPSVSVAVGNRAPESPGTLYITTRQVIWLSELDREKGYAVDFLSLSLYAVSRDPEAYPSPCIYTQIETEADEVEDESEDSDSECSEVLDLSKIREMRFIPSDANQCVLIQYFLLLVLRLLFLSVVIINTDLCICSVKVDTLFQVFCECTELNPEPIEEGAEEGHNWIFSADQLEDEAGAGDDVEWHFSQNPTNTIGHSNGHHDLASSVLELQINDQRFEDAEEMEQVIDTGHHHQSQQLLKRVRWHLISQPCHQLAHSLHIMVWS
ncbi:hypothetical protein J1N35_013988 [Gossypium stocksii]|uniref:Chloride conductance regulatory protein ICln n=1 Tax=Gossypium stocksii TaxID=47602 RepID=A0A9D3VTE9_9ROSI|nr:hypothetical protein J1N35_013988 [Gossypium stocksii]